MKEDLVTAHSFSDQEEAIEAAAVLKEKGIEHYIEEEKLAFDVTFAYKTAPYSIHLKVKASELQQALELIDAAMTSEERTDVTIENFMDEFTDEELEEVIYKRDEWNTQDVDRAEELLKRRGIAFSEGQKQSMWQQRLQEIRTPRKANTGWMIMGFAAALGGGLFGVAMGASYFFLRGRDPEGQRYYVYDKGARSAGFVMMLIGLAILIGVMWYAYDYIWGLDPL